MGQYTNKGLYNSYDKKNKEREALDYYATPTAEVYNILNHLQIDFSNSSILEPCVGGGHMARGIENYITEKDYQDIKLICSDIKDRGFVSPNWEITYGLDFFSDDYPDDKADWIIMNPPYSVIEPFVIRSLEIAEKGVIMLARLQFLEGEGRFEKILKETPPNEVWIYVDRVQCWKNGEKPEGTSAQAYAWFVWYKNGGATNPKLNWLRREDKVDKK